MSSLAADTFERVVKRVAKLRKKQPWQNANGHSWVRPLHDEGWGKVSEIIIDAMDEMKLDGSAQPLAALQEIAFAESLKQDAVPAVHTVALWLTDTRLRVDIFRANPDDVLMRRSLEQRGLLRPRAGDEP